MATVTIEKEFGYVVLVGLGSMILSQYLGSRVMNARQKYGVKYPNLYASLEDVKVPEDKVSVALFLFNKWPM